MSFSYKAVYKSLITNIFSEQHFFADSDNTAREKATEYAKFPLILTSLISFEEKNRTRDVGLKSKSEIVQITIKDDYSKED